MSLALSRIDILHDRAHLFAQVRSFFAKRGVVEVDVPVLNSLAPVDLFIDLIPATFQGERCYLSSSPEYGMKRLLAEGIGDIYQLSHVFRHGEVGERHNPEFVMVEWYRVQKTLHELILETLEFARLFLQEERFEMLSYEEAFLRYAGVDFRKVEDRFYTLAFDVEPKMKGFVALYDFPAEDAALARVEGEVAKRFELFYNGVEIANGYDELGDASQLRERFEKANLMRQQKNKPPYPIDEDFLAALERGFPACVGVAVGFDRLMMLRHQATHINEVIPFAW